MSVEEEFMQIRRQYRSKWNIPKASSTNFSIYKEIEDVSRLPRSYTDIDISLIERRSYFQETSFKQVSFAEVSELPDQLSCCDGGERKKVTGRRKLLYQLKLAFVKLRASLSDKTKKEEIIASFKKRQSIVSHISTNLNDADDKKEMNDMFEWEDQLQNNADVGGEDESETEDEEQDEAALQPTTADDFNKANMEDEAEMDDGGDDPDNEDEEEDQMAEVESEIEALLEIPVLLCVDEDCHAPNADGLNSQQSGADSDDFYEALAGDQREALDEGGLDLNLSGTDEDLSDGDFSFDSGDDRPPS